MGGWEGGSGIEEGWEGGKWERGRVGGWEEGWKGGRKGGRKGERAGGRKGIVFTMLTHVLFGHVVISQHMTFSQSHFMNLATYYR